MDFTTPAAYAGLTVQDSNGWQTVVLPAGSTVYRADPAGKRTPSEGVPNFFSDKESIRPYMRGKSEAETVTSYKTTKDLTLFVMTAANVTAVAGMDEYADFMNNSYIVEVEDEDGNQMIAVEPSTPLKVTKTGKVLEYTNRKFAEIVCKLGFEGWIALPDTDLGQLNIDMDYYRETGELAKRVNPYTPEIVLCDWKTATASAAGGFKMPRKYSRKYCKKTPCKKMGFTQRSSCRPYKNCFTRRRGRRSA